jgi:dissimilatory sulfite reductase (desulfoviridin) alpha/beta subunit
MASLWHDLGVNYYYQMKATNSALAADFAYKSLEVLKKCVSLNQSNSAHWNALGVVAATRGCLYCVKCSLFLFM